MRAYAAPVALLIACSSARPSLQSSSVPVAKPPVTAPPSGPPAVPIPEPPQAMHGPTFADGSWSVTDLQQLDGLTVGESVAVTAFFDSRTACSPCPPGVRCKPCLPPVLNIADQYVARYEFGGETATQSLPMLRLAQPPDDGLVAEERYRFECTVRVTSPLELTYRSHHWAPLEPAPGTVAPTAVPPAFTAPHAAVLVDGANAGAAALSHDHGQGVVVYWSPAGLEIHHAFRSLCCTTVHPSVTQSGSGVTLSEWSSSKGCRCMGHSEVLATLPILPGQHRVQVRDGGNTLFDQVITVPADGHERVPLAGEQQHVAPGGPPPDAPSTDGPRPHPIDMNL